MAPPSDVLAIHGGTPVIASEEAGYVWPVITPDLEAVVLRQLHREVSIRDNGGVFGEFERKFAEFHNRRYALVSNSGTSAILAMFEGLELGPGDEVIAPVYTFHATASPAVYLGANVLFADVDSFGGMDASSVEERITSRTRAVILTHLWGLPARSTQKLAHLCGRSGIPLLEDCSHAHGAMLTGHIPVGSIGVAAAWSLQGQKIISGGEGGVTATDDREIFERALLQGHYNRRTRDEISRDSPLWPYHQTGLGLKLRAHPLAIAIAAHQFDNLEATWAVRDRHAHMLARSVSEFEFLDVQLPREGERASWYALPIRYRGANDLGFTREWFVRALHAEGLSEVDIPSATNLLNSHPLFTHPERVLGSRFPSRPGLRADPFNGAAAYASEIVKLPVWAFPSDQTIVEKYCAGLRKVCQFVKRHS